MTLLRQESIHPSYQTEKKRVRKPSTEDKATGDLDAARRNNRGKGRKVPTNRAEADGKANKNVGKAQNRNGKVENLVRK